MNLATVIQELLAVSPTFGSWARSIENGVAAASAPQNLRQTFGASSDTFLATNPSGADILATNIQTQDNGGFIVLTASFNGVGSTAGAVPVAAELRVNGVAVAKANFSAKLPEPSGATMTARVALGAIANLPVTIHVTPSAGQFQNFGPDLSVQLTIIESKV